MYYKFLSLALCLASMCVFFFKLGLAIVAVVDPCEQFKTTTSSLLIKELPGSRQADFNSDSRFTTNQVCLEPTELFFRILLLIVNGVILTGHLLALLTEDSLLIGMVIGSEVRYFLLLLRHFFDKRSIDIISY